MNSNLFIRYITVTVQVSDSTVSLKISSGFEICGHYTEPQVGWKFIKFNHKLKVESYFLYSKHTGYKPLERSLCRPRRLPLFLHIQYALLGVRWVDGYLVVCVNTGWVWRLPQYQQSCLIAEPHNEFPRCVWLCNHT